MMTTFWCEPNSSACGSVFSTSEKSHPESESIDAVRHGTSHDAKVRHLVDWNVTMFAVLLKEVVANRDNQQEFQDPICRSADFTKPVEDVRDEIDLFTSYSPELVRKMDPPSRLCTSVMVQLRELVESIAQLYHDNPFHNFEHCSHVVMSTRKLLNRIADKEKEVQHQTGSTASCTFGITSSPLNQFAIVFAALIHDLDHSGVSNARLVEEKHPLAVSYDGKSVAEQNSIDVAWRLLMQPQFADLRKCIYRSEAELAQFRQILVNTVLATDLFDKTLKEMRETRWNKAFAGSEVDTEESESCEVNRKAAIILDLIIQASDVSHTMQHFTVYKKWNMKLLDEMYTAYKNGRMTKDPTEGWYEGELWFFDNYVIPLAQKLRECQVFGVSCDEFLDYAHDNRLEWEMKGREIVREASMALQSRALQMAVKTSFEI
jgi:3'5'-cyclic nucleotide phosphodiesterase